ncbi:MAG: DUF2779 domain-containing protein [Fibrobacter sp.]|nr:DUF2779 domain-containing protein [Fibrobacter sp.]
MSEKLFTKSAFKIATHCRTQAYYYRNSDVYENLSASDDFLKSLAEGGFQVGELAKIYGEVPPENDLENCTGYDIPLKRTRELFEQENVNVAEAAFRFGNCFVRADVVQKKGNVVNLIEVKAKSWNSETDVFINNKETVNREIRDYLYDVAFQKWVVENALKVDYPGEKFKVHAFLMMPDKSKVNTIQGLNGLFRVKKEVCQDGEKRAYAEAVPGAKELLQNSHEHILVAFPVDDECQKVIDGKTAEQESVLGTGMKFVPFIEAESLNYVNNTRTFCNLGAKCFGCPFALSDEGKAKGLKSGFKECWRNTAKLQDADFDELGRIKEARHFIKDLWGAYLGGRKNEWVSNGKFFIDDLTDRDVPAQARTRPESGLDHCERKWIQINGVKSGKADAFIMRDELRTEMATWKFPLHMIDFETTASALPYFRNMRPYEQVAFQFSHHIIYEDGRIEHAGQFLETRPSVFPNFDFIRELKRQLENDEGSVFRYATHENTILNAIRVQLLASNESDKDELIEFIESITYENEDRKAGIPARRGIRCMIDLCEIVKRFYWHPIMKGSNSIKVVLPAILNSGTYLQEKYGKPIYGSEIKSKNYTGDHPFALIIKDEQGGVKNPYKILPQLQDIEKSLVEEIAQNNNISQEDLWAYLKKNNADEMDADGDTQINNGGLPLVLFRSFQALDPNKDWENTLDVKNISPDALKYKALREGLLKYCELDTMAMVLVWEYFNHEIK